jgi:NADPH:quinone reductase-like Zn-dependent oxidoreductase
MDLSRKMINGLNSSSESRDFILDLIFKERTYMKAAICTSYGSHEVLQIQEILKPIPKDSEILVKIMASAVNSGDVRVRSLNVKGILKVIMRLVLGISKPRKPVLGTVFSGVVESIGSKVSKFKVGNKVFGMTGFSFGTHTEYIAVNQNNNMLEMPQNASFEDAASIVFGGQTALYYLSKSKIAYKKNAKVLILGATGSVGSAAVQIAKYYNAHVTAVCSADGEKMVSELGVTDVILYDKQDFAQHSGRFDIIFDAVGKYSKKQCRHLLNSSGVYVSVSIGYASENIKQLQQLKEMFEKRVLKATIDKIYTLDEIVEAHEYVESGRKKGNVLLKINDSIE